MTSLGCTELPVPKVCFSKSYKSKLYTFSPQYWLHEPSFLSVKEVLNTIGDLYPLHLEQMNSILSLHRLPPVAEDTRIKLDSDRQVIIKTDSDRQVIIKTDSDRQVMIKADSDKQVMMKLDSNKPVKIKLDSS